MRNILFICLALGLLSPLRGQVVSSNVADYSPEQMDELVAPIALYPDPLVALILPASSVPSDIVLAERYFEANGDPNLVDSQSWDASVRALAHYPDIIKWMSDNLDWTTTLGQQFLLEPVQVMESVQQLRAQARANGALVNTPQQTVVLDGSDIEIVPAQPDSICVPEYDPDSVFIEQSVPYSSPIIIFGPPCWVGPWLDYECDWGNFGVWITVWRPGWDYLRDWHCPRTAANRGSFWRPDATRERAAHYAATRGFRPPPHPHPMAAAPSVVSRPAPGARPSYGENSSRPDSSGWRVDAQGHLAVTPAPVARQTGPRVILSGPAADNRPAPRQPGNRPAPPRSPSPPPVLPAPPTPVPQAPGAGPIPQALGAGPVPRVLGAGPATGVLVGGSSSGTPQVPGAGPANSILFGGYSRGTEARDYSNRGQASLQAARPSAPAPRAAPSAPRAAPVAPPPRSAPSSSGGNDGQQRKR